MATTIPIREGVKTAGKCVCGVLIALWELD